MSHTKQVIIAGVCQHWPLPCLDENSEMYSPSCLQSVATPQQTFLTASEQCAILSPLKTAY